jgi:NAD(P)-dependent dehydrogenase (short-subunit alcohol dehydrogenase family)
MTGRVDGKIAVVTGSTRGLDEGIARPFAEESARVIVMGRKRDAGEAISRSICESGGKSQFIYLDLEDEGSVAGLLA